jgi:adenosylmethionine-8-amino-7-oxononanoate aminotransferase
MPPVELERARRFPLIDVPRATPLMVERAEGAHLIIADGRRILDAAGGAIVANIGHGRREVADVAARALAELSYALPSQATPGRVQLVERLTERWLPPGLTRAVFTSGGSESMDSAIRLALLHQRARGEPGRWKVIGRDLSYHGTTLASLAVGGHTARRAGFEPWLIDLPKLPACYCLRCPLGRTYPSCAVACAEALEELLEREGADSVAAVVAEPIGGATAGGLDPPDEYWPRLAEICRRNGVLLIADEVMSGFGRTGKRFGVDHFGVVPDILIGGKGLSGGYAPIGGIFAQESVVAPIAASGESLMFFTYGAHPACCAIADRVLDILEREQLVDRAAELGRDLRARLARLESHPHVAQVRGRGLLIGIELVRDRDTLAPFAREAQLSAKVVAAGLEESVLFYRGGIDPARDVIVLGPPFIIGAAEVEEIAQVLERAIDVAVRRVEASGAA